MERALRHPVLAVIVFIGTVTGALCVRCYQCYINPPPGELYNTTRLCTHFDGGDRFVVDCPFSTVCMKQSFHLDIQNGVRIDGVLRDCAPQKYMYQDFKNGKWSPKTDILEPYKEGCHDLDDDGERAPTTSYCYCKKDLCNSSSKTDADSYIDIMGVIVVFNLIKYIYSFR